MDVDAARNRSYRRIGGLARRSRIRVAGIESLTFGPVPDILAGKVDAHLLDSDLLGEIRRQRVAEVDVL